DKPLQAASKAGMSCVVTYTSSTAEQDFKEAVAIYPDLSNNLTRSIECSLQAAWVCYDLLHATAAERRGPVTNRGDVLDATRIHPAACTKDMIMDIALLCF
ncbi:haloacid dehalogenase-like hydrolase, partial [Trifolium pratense]